MPSPFPGMDPWLEYHGGDVKTRFVVLAADQLQPQLANDLRVRIQEVEPTKCESGEEAAFVNRISNEEPTERFIEIRGFRGGPLVTVIEILSPTDKTGAGIAEYSLKRLELAADGVTLVEIDLLRQGDVPWYAEAGSLAEDQTYHVEVRPGWDTMKSHAYPIRLRDRLPPFRVPLRHPDESAVLELQPNIDQIYETGCYEDNDYSEAPPGPPLNPSDAAWVETQLRQAGRLGTTPGYPPWFPSCNLARGYH